MSTVKSFCCLETAAGTSRTGLVAELSLATSFVCRRPLVMSLLELGRKTLVAVFFGGCKFAFLSDAVVFCSRTGGFCVDDDKLRSVGVSTRCVTFIMAAVVLDVVLLVGKPVPHIHHCYISKQCIICCAVQIMSASICTLKVTKNNEKILTERTVVRAYVEPNFI